MNVAQFNVSREGRCRLELMKGERLACGKCEEIIYGRECPLVEENVAYITRYGDTSEQDFVILCQCCLDELAGPEFEEMKEATK
jgi:hypothetical protein